MLTKRIPKNLFRMLDCIFGYQTILELKAFMHIDGQKNPADIMSKHWGYTQVWPQLRTLLFR